MRAILFLTVSLFALFAFNAALTAADASLNSLTKAEANDGWRLLFDGKSLDQWRGYKKETLPDGWKVQDDGSFCRTGGGDIVTKEQFDSFDLMIEWKISPGGNSGIFYRATEAHGAIYESAPEMQVLDNTKHGDGKNPKTSAGANYALIPPPKDVTKPAGEWNQARLLVDGQRVEHWLNGEKLLEYTLGSPEWTELVKGSKFAGWSDYGKALKGHLGLQDHGDQVWYRNVKIRTPADVAEAKKKAKK
mgnify:CR=1 FL=1